MRHDLSRSQKKYRCICIHRNAMWSYPRPRKKHPPAFHSENERESLRRDSRSHCLIVVNQRLQSFYESSFHDSLEPRKATSRLTWPTKRGISFRIHLSVHNRLRPSIASDRIVASVNLYSSISLAGKDMCNRKVNAGTLFMYGTEHRPAFQQKPANGILIQNTDPGGHVPQPGDNALWSRFQTSRRALDACRTHSTFRRAMMHIGRSAHFRSEGDDIDFCRRYLMNSVCLRME